MGLKFLELRRRHNSERKTVVWHPPNMTRRSSSRNSEPPYIPNLTHQVGRPTMALRSQSLRMAPGRSVSGLERPPPSPVSARRGSAIFFPMERPIQGK